MAAQSIAASWLASLQTKHISFKHHHVLDMMSSGVILRHYVSSKNQPADLLRKVITFDTIVMCLHCSTRVMLSELLLSLSRAIDRIATYRVPKIPNNRRKISA